MTDRERAIVSHIEDDHSLTVLLIRISIVFAAVAAIFLWLLDDKALFVMAGSASFIALIISAIFPTAKFSDFEESK